MNLIYLVEKIVSFFKNDPSYRIKIQLSNRELIEILRIRGFQLIRGVIKKIHFGESKGIIFCGRSVILEHAYKIKSGPGLILEDYVHLNALSEEGLFFGRNVTIAKYSSLVCTGVIANKGKGIKIGDYSAIGAHSFIGGQGGVLIGDNVIMGPGVKIFSENHNFDHLHIPIRLQGETRKGVNIGSNCWIGAGVIILDGVTIGEGCVIAAGAVVTKDIPPNTIAAGVPAKVIKTRG
jgi:acetyltransferase-like isoleucine patch superfamily enzyme